MLTYVDCSLYIRSIVIIVGGVALCNIVFVAVPAFVADVVVFRVGRMGRCHRGRWLFSRGSFVCGGSYRCCGLSGETGQRLRRRERDAVHPVQLAGAAITHGNNLHVQGFFSGFCNAACCPRPGSSGACERCTHAGSLETGELRNRRKMCRKDGWTERKSERERDEERR